MVTLKYWVFQRNKWKQKAVTKRKCNLTIDDFDQATNDACVKIYVSGFMHTEREREREREREQRRAADTCMR